MVECWEERDRGKEEIIKLGLDKIRERSRKGGDEQVGKCKKRIDI